MGDGIQIFYIFFLAFYVFLKLKSIKLYVKFVCVYVCTYMNFIDISWSEGTCVTTMIIIVIILMMIMILCVLKIMLTKDNEKFLIIVVCWAYIVILWDY